MLKELLSSIYGIAIKGRKVLYDKGILKKVPSPIPAISVGNICCGGRGKTEMVSWIARYLKEKGKRVAIISRGYKGKKHGVVRDFENIYMGKEAGDEAFMLAKELCCLILSGKDRVYLAHLAKEYGAECVVLDDGFQYIRMEKDLDILMLGEEDLFRGYLLPKGMLREPKEEILRAHITVLHNVKRENEEKCKEIIKSINPYAKILSSFYEPLHFIDREGREYPLSVISGKKIVCFSGIASSAYFESILHSLCGELFCIRYKDHYMYHLADIAYIIECAIKEDADFLVTTKKDAVRLPPFVEVVPLLILCVRIKMNDEDLLKQIIDEKIP